MAFASHQQPATSSPNEHVRCSACKVNVLPNQRNSHYRSDWHRYNVKRKCVSMEPIEKSLFEDKLKTIIASGRKMNSISNKKKKKALNKTIQKNYDILIHNNQWNQWNQSSNSKTPSSLLNYSCTLCSKTFKTHQQCVSHLNTKKHKIKFIQYHKKLRDQQQDEIDVFHATNDPPQLQDSAQNPAAPNINMDNLIPLHQLSPMKTIKNNPFISIKQVVIKKRGFQFHNNDDESKLNEIDHEIEGDKTDSPAPNRFAISPSNCLFCTETFESMDLSISHMTARHGFFVPLPKRLTNVNSLNSLLETAGHIIGKFYQCVWCWKIFKSLRGVQTHMRHQAHCKLQIEYSSNMNENAESPFVKYFDFDKVIVDSDEDEDVDVDGSRELIVVEKKKKKKRYVTEINECDELVRNDGTVIGHRDNMVIYRQKHGRLSTYHETQSEEQIIAQINNPQKKYKLQEMEREKNIKAFENSGAKQQHKNAKIKEHEAMNLQTRAHKVSYQNWVNLQKSKQLMFN